MATKKPKSQKANKAKSTKPKTAAKTVTEPVSEAPITSSAETTAVAPKEVKETKESTPAPAKSGLRGFFSKKYDGAESILTIFKRPSFYGALLGEVVGTALITLLLFAVSLMGLYSMATYSFALVAVFIAVYAFSGACLNPLITIGMMASRRISVIRGIMYIIAEVIGAWLGWLIFNAFHTNGGEAAYDLPALTAAGEGQFWPYAMIELLGAILIAFFFARALKYKRSVFTFGAVVAGGMVLSIIVSYVISAAYFSLSSNYVFNPATALMMQIFPTSGEDFSEIIGGVGQALAIYCLFPMIGGVCGFYLSDFIARLNGDAE